MMTLLAHAHSDIEHHQMAAYNPHSNLWAEGTACNVNKFLEECMSWEEASKQVGQSNPHIRKHSGMFLRQILFKQSLWDKAPVQPGKLTEVRVISYCRAVGCCYIKLVQAQA